MCSYLFKFCEINLLHLNASFSAESKSSVQTSFFANCPLLCDMNEPGGEYWIHKLLLSPLSLFCFPFFLKWANYKAYSDVAKMRWNLSSSWLLGAQLHFVYATYFHRFLHRVQFCLLVQWMYGQATGLNWIVHPSERGKQTEWEIGRESVPERLIYVIASNESSWLLNGTKVWIKHWTAVSQWRGKVEAKWIWASQNLSRNM